MCLGPLSPLAGGGVGVSPCGRAPCAVHARGVCVLGAADDDDAMTDLAHPAIGGRGDLPRGCDSLAVVILCRAVRNFRRTGLARLLFHHSLLSLAFAMMHYRVGPPAELGWPPPGRRRSNPSLSFPPPSTFEGRHVGLCGFEYRLRRTFHGWLSIRALPPTASERVVLLLLVMLVLFLFLSPFPSDPPPSFHPFQTLLCCPARPAGRRLCS